MKYVPYLMTIDKKKKEAKPFWRKAHKKMCN